MDTHNLIFKLQQAKERSLYLASQERAKKVAGEHGGFDLREQMRSFTRENFFQGQSETIDAITEEIRSFDSGGDKEEFEEVVFLARRLIAEVSYPWIRRKSLAEDLYGEIYKDNDFDCYAKDLDRKRASLESASVGILLLEDSFEKELEALLNSFLQRDGNRGTEPLVGDLLMYKNEVVEALGGEDSAKVKLLVFRLYEFGLI